ncbi:hypothetical protein FHT32_004777 [Variovorax sp. SG517]|uniref:hypothetical protein n=1 Tax=Variovorax sp. SG517 TaxID=2587117 RepID=UPI00159E3D74|nr:hypothetical protein [Variovorax sp. SG517]NVM91113.1 hypothetical protein [Variovorax sp. SG517]
MQNNPGRTAQAKPAAKPAPRPEFTDEELQAFDRAYAQAKQTGALIRLETEAAMRIDTPRAWGLA